MVKKNLYYILKYINIFQDFFNLNIVSIITQ